MIITIELKNNDYCWTLKDNNTISTHWAKSLGDVFEQIIKDINRPIDKSSTKWVYSKPIIGMDDKGRPIAIDTWHKKNM